MQANNNRWETRRRHLLRNFLVNPGFPLSPIPEERSSTSPDGGPLPDLLVEPEPNRDRHDHPPEFYERLERRIMRYYRKLFFGASSDDDDSADFEVNRTMGSTFMLDTNTRKDTEANIVAERSGFDRDHSTYASSDDDYSADFEVNRSMGTTFMLDTNTRKYTEASILAERSGFDQDDSILKKRQSTQSINEIHEDDASENQDKYDDKLIDTCATNNGTGHVSVNSKSSITEDDENPRSINESNYSSETDDDRNVNIEANGNSQSYEDKDLTNGDKINRSGALNETEKTSVNSKSSNTEDDENPRSINESNNSNETDDDRNVNIEANGNSQSYEDKDLTNGDKINRSGALNETEKTSVNSKSSNTEDDENPRSINESNYSNETDDDRNVNIEANGNNQSYEDKDSNNGDKLNRSGALNETEKTSEFIETKSDSDEVPCHRVSTTVAEMHERRAKDSTHVFDDGSPVLIPSFLQFSKRVCGSRRISGQTFNVSEAFDEFIRRPSSHKSDVSNKQEDQPETDVERLLTASEVTRASTDSDKIRRVFISSSEESFDDSEPIAESTAKAVDEVEVMRDARGSGANVSWHEEAVQDSPASAFERQTDADKLENDSSVSTVINASFEQEIQQATEDPHLDAIAKTTYEPVFPIEVDIEETRGSKRRTDLEGDAIPKQRKKDVAIQTGLQENMNWEDIRTGFFVGTPLVLRLCGCPGHICSGRVNSTD